MIFSYLSGETRQLENLVFLHLCRCFGRERVFFLRDERGHEVDFLVTREKALDCYQVCHFLTDENSDREFRPLLRLLKNHSNTINQENHFRLVYLKDLRKNKTNTEHLETIPAAEFLLFTTDLE